MPSIFDKDYHHKQQAAFDENFAKLSGGKPPAKTLNVRRGDAPILNVKLAAKKATIYHQSEIGGAPRGIEVTALAYAVAPYAQYPRALFMYFVPKGKRNVREIVDAYKPTTLIVEGWNHPKEAGATYHAPVQSSSGAIVTKGRYLAHDPRYEKEAKEFMDNYLKAVKANVIIDFRE